MTEIIISKLSANTLYPLFYKFRMTENEQKVFHQYIKVSKHYLEFGSGGSTLRVLQKSKAKIFSVESSREWINYLSKYLIIRKAKNKRLFFHYVNIGETQRWGYPVSLNSDNHLLSNYSKDVFSSLDMSSIDTVLVDGRFRVACVLSVILNTPPQNNIIILIHDFWNREKYHVVLKYLTEVERADTLGVFKIQPNVNLSLVADDYEIYKNTHD